MATSTIRDINIALGHGELPPELNFSKRDDGDNVDWEKVRYNTFFRSAEFVAQRFPAGQCFLNMPGGEDILKRIASRMPLPADEMILRRKSSYWVLEDENDEKKDADQTEGVVARCAEIELPKTG